VGGTLYACVCVCILTLLRTETGYNIQEHRSSNYP